MDAKEPDIDDLSTIDSLRTNTATMLLSCANLEKFKDSLLASMFFFELLEVVEQEDSYACTGNIAVD